VIPVKTGPPKRDITKNTKKSITTDNTERTEAELASSPACDAGRLKRRAMLKTQSGRLSSLYVLSVASTVWRRFAAPTKRPAITDL